VGVISPNVLNQRRPTGEGTYRVCEGCPSSKACCTRVSPDGEMGQPVLLPEDVKKISEATGLDASAFLVPNSGSPSGLARLASGETGCMFHEGGRCIIYDVRPTDCRLFPFDLVERGNGEIVWVAYTDLCPTSYDPRSFFEEVKPLLARLHPHVREFARDQPPGMAVRERIELGPVDLDFGIDAGVGV